MAYYKAQATGNWSAPATWAGTSVPPTTGGDFVYAAGFTVTIDTNVNVSLLTTLSAAQGLYTFVGGSLSAATGGTFNISSVTGTRSVTATQILAGSTVVLNITNPTGNVTISAAGGIQASATNSNVQAIAIGNITGTVTVYGDVSGGGGAATNCFGIDTTTLASGGTVNLYGIPYSTSTSAAIRSGGAVGSNFNIYGPLPTQRFNTGHFSHTGTGTCTVTGNVISQNLGTASLITNTGTGTITIYGDLSASQTINSAVAVNNQSTGTINVIGNVYGGSVGSYGINNGSSGTVNVSGTVIPGPLGGNGIQNGGSGSTAIANITRIKGSNYGPNTVGIVYASAIANGTQTSIARFYEIEYGPFGAAPHGTTGTFQLIDSSSNKSIFYTPVSTTKTLVDPAATTDFPPASSVRSGTKYNNNSITGTLAVPPTSAVSQGIAVDNTVGTAALTPDSVWNYALSAATTLNTVGNKISKTITKSDFIALS